MASQANSLETNFMKVFSAYLAFTLSAISLAGYAMQGVAAGLEAQAAERAATIEQILR